MLVLTTPEEADRQLPSIGSQLGVDFRKDRVHVAERNEKWAEMSRVHEKIIRAEEKGI